MADIQDAVYMKVVFHSDDVRVPITWTAQDTSLVANFGAVHEIHTGETYEGEYFVTPSEVEQTLETATYLMERNVVVAPIPSNYGLITWNGTTLTVS